MKFILTLITFVFVSSAIACDQLELSKAIASNYQSMIDDRGPGKYYTKVQIDYQIPLTNDIPRPEPILVTIPVLLLPFTKIEFPSKVENCAENEESFACVLAKFSFSWYEQTRPVDGQFLINLQIATSIREFALKCDTDRME